MFTHVEFNSLTLCIDYDSHLRKYYITNCECYADYKNIVHLVSTCNFNYVGCIRMSSGQIIHKILPIMFGSKLDYEIRKVDDDPFVHLYGTFYLNTIKYIQYYFINNLKNNHIYSVRNGENRFIFKTLNFHIECQYENDELIFKEESPNWIDAINSESPVHEKETDKHIITREDYCKFFSAVLQYGPKLDDLNNKLLVTSGFIFERVLVLFDKKKVFDAEKLKLLFIAGNLSFTMYNNKFNYEVDKYHCIYNPIESYKIVNIKHIINTIRRVSHTKRIHINQIRFTDDDFFFICPISTKEIKNAGENVSSAMLTTTSIQIEFDTIYQIVKEESVYRLNHKQDDDEYRISFGMHLSNFYIKRDRILNIKRRNTFIVLYIYNDVLSVSSTSNVFMKYVPMVNLFCTQFELKLFFFNDINALHYLKFSSISRNLPMTIIMQQPAKAVVAVNNIKGQTFEPISQEMIHLFLSSVGYNSMLIYDHNITPNDVLLNVIFDNENADGCIKTKIKKLNERSNAELELVERECTPVQFTDIQREVFSILDESDFKLFGSYSYEDFIGESNVSDKILKLLNMNLKHKYKWNSEYREHSQIQLYTIFGDIDGHTNEDGIILDESIFKYGPKFLESVTFHVRCINAIEGDKYCYQGKKFKMNSSNVDVKYIQINKRIDDVLFFGIIESKYKLNIRASKNITVRSDELKKKGKSVLFKYYIYVETLLVHLDIKLFSYYDKTNNIAICNYRFLTPLCVGKKLADLQGQKSVISAIKDLSIYKCKNRYGQICHPQVMFSPISIIGRLTVSQVYEMFMSEKLAISDDGSMFIAPLRYNVHNMSAERELKIGESRLDLMTVENGIQANNLGNLFYHLISKNKELMNKTKNNMHILMELYKLNGININPITSIKMLEDKKTANTSEKTSFFDDKSDDESSASDEC